MERSDERDLLGDVVVSDIKRRKVEDSMRSLFFGESKGGKVEKCEICLGEELSSGGGKVIAPLRETLSEEVVGLVLKSLLVPKGNLSGVERRALWLCGGCTASLISLTHLFLQLEGLRWEFNDLRRKVGRQVILGSLGESEEVWDEWEKDVRGVEDMFPSCVGNKKEVRDVGVTTEGDSGIFDRGEGDLENDCDLVLESVETSSDEDIKLKKMTPVVLLERLKETCQAEMTEKFWFEEDETKSEVFKIAEDRNTGVSIEGQRLLNPIGFEIQNDVTPTGSEVGIQEDLDFIKNEEGVADEEDFVLIYKSPISSPKERVFSRKRKKRICGQNLKSKRVYVKAKINANGVRSYQCDCGMLHAGKQSKYRCMQSHKYPPQKCDKCYKHYARRDNFYRHYRSIHRIDFVTGEPFL